MVIMRLDEETAKVMDPTKGSRRKQSKPNRVSLVDLSPAAGGGGPHRPLLAEAKELDAELPQTSGLHEDMHDDDDMDGAAVAAHGSVDRAAVPAEVPTLSFACHLCGLGFSTTQLLEQHERNVHLKADAMQPGASGEFPTAYHRLASELLARPSSKVLAADDRHAEEHDMMDVSTDEGIGAAGGGEGGVPKAQGAGVFHPEAYCEICQREFCNKYFLKTHKANIHGVHDSGGAAGSVPKDTTPPGHALDRERPSGVAAAAAAAAAAASPAMPAVAGVTVPATSGGVSKEMYSGVINSGGDICDICQKPFRNKYYIKRHKLHVHGVAVSSPLTPGVYHAAVVDAMQQPSPRSSLDAGLPLSVPSPGAATVPGPLLSEHVTTDTDSLVGCNMCTRKFSSMHAVKIHRASAHGVYARDLAAAATAAAAAVAAAGVPLPVSRGSLSSILVEAAGAKSERPATCDPAAAYKRGPAAGGAVVAGAYLPPAAEVRPGPGGAATPRHVHLPFESVSSRVRGAQPVGGGMLDAGAASLALVAHSLPADGAGWPSTLSSSGSVPSTVVALSYHGPGASAAAASAMATSAVASAEGIEGGKVSLLLPPVVPPESLSLDAQDVFPKDASVSCDQCQKSFASAQALNAHKLTAHLTNKPASELPLTVTDVASAAGQSFAVGYGPTPLPGSVNAVGGNADSAGVTEYKQWRWKEHANQTRVYCDICNKELCNKYFLRTHKLKKHGISASLDGGEAVSAAALSPYGRGGASPLFAAQAASVAASSREPGVDPSAESCSNSGDAEAERFQSSERSGSSAADASGGEGAWTEEGAGDAPAAATAKLAAPADLSGDGRSAAVSAAAHLANQGVKIEAGTCRSCGMEFNDLQAAVSHVCEPSGGIAGLPSDGGGVVQGLTAEELMSGGGSGTLPFAALLGMQKFQWKSRGGRAAVGGGLSASAGEKLYSCSRCDYKTPWLSNIYSHEQRKHGGGSANARGGGATPHTCTVCLRTFSYEHSLMRHMADYHNGAGSGGSVIVTSTQPSGGTAVSPRRHQRARCPYCNKQFVNKFLCQSHIRASHGAAALPAAIGGSGSNGYTVMRAGATGYKLYACDRCGFKCRTLSNLRMHQVIKHAAAPTPDAVDDSAAQELMEDASDPTASAAAAHLAEEAGDDGGMLTNGSALLSPTSGVSALATAAHFGGRHALPGADGGADSAEGVIMQPFVVEAVEGGPEFALTGVHLPVYRKVKGSVQVTLTLRSVDD